jgi:hypothetical protein
MNPTDPAERTRLAWRRTALAATVVTLLEVRLAGGNPVATAAAVGCWLVVAATCWRRITALAAPWTRAGLLLAAVTLGIVSLALVGGLIVGLRGR